MNYIHGNFTMKTQIQTARNPQIKLRRDPAVRRKKSVMLLGDNEPMRGNAAVQMTLTHTNVNGSHTSTAIPRLDASLRIIPTNAIDFGLKWHDLSASFLPPKLIRSFFNDFRLAININGILIISLYYLMVNEHVCGRTWLQTCFSRNIRSCFVR